MKIVILDTNFIVYLFRYKIDLFSELNRILESYDVYMFDKSLDELEKLEEKLSLKFAKTLKKLKAKEKHVDDAIVKYSEDNENVIVGTQDKELKKRLRCPVMVIRQKKYLQLKK